MHPYFLKVTSVDVVIRWELFHMIFQIYNEKFRLDHHENILHVLFCECSAQHSLEYASSAFPLLTTEPFETFFLAAALTRRICCSSSDTSSFVKKRFISILNVRLRNWTYLKTTVVTAAVLFVLQNTPAMALRNEELLSSLLKSDTSNNSSRPCSENRPKDPDPSPLLKKSIYNAYVMKEFPQKFQLLIKSWQKKVFRLLERLWNAFFIGLCLDSFNSVPKVIHKRLFQLATFFKRKQMHYLNTEDCRTIVTWFYSKQSKPTQ